MHRPANRLFLEGGSEEKNLFLVLFLPMLIYADLQGPELVDEILQSGLKRAAHL